LITCGLAWQVAAGVLVQKSLMPKGVDHFVSVSIEQERALRAKIFDAERR